MAQCLLLDPAAYVVDGSVGQGDGVERVDHQDGVAQVVGDAVGVAPEGVDGHRVDPGQLLRRSRSQPVVHRLGAATWDDVDETASLQVHELVAKVVWRWALARRKATSSRPSAVTLAARSGSSTSGRP